MNHFLQYGANFKTFEIESFVVGNLNSTYSCKINRNDIPS